MLRLPLRSYHVSLIVLLSTTSIVYGMVCPAGLVDQELCAIFENNIKKPATKIISEIEKNPATYTMTVKEDANTKFDAGIVKINNFSTKQLTNAPAKSFIQAKFNQIYANEFALRDRMRSNLLALENSMKTYQTSTKKQKGFVGRLKSKLSSEKTTYVTEAEQEKAQREVRTALKQLETIQLNLQSLKTEVRNERAKTADKTIENQVLILLEYYLGNMITILEAVITKTRAQL